MVESTRTGSQSDLVLVDDAMNRRELLRWAGCLCGATFALRLDSIQAKPLEIAVIADLHYGLAPDALSRLETFVEETLDHKDVDLAIQMGDFCYSDAASVPALKLWSRLTMPTLHVLGNHDMDRCDKNAVVKMWAMQGRYRAMSIGGYRFVVLDLNHFKKHGKPVSYANGNYFTADATHNWADPEQLAWLAGELRRSREPAIVLSHQPLGFASPGKPLPPEQIEVLNVITSAAKANPKGAVAACLCGHMHVDRLEQYEGIPCYCINSASYFWSAGMFPYTKPLFAYIEISATGEVRVEGVTAKFVKPPPAASDAVQGRSASIANRQFRLRAESREGMRETA
jgi:predicted phosphodiesterase